MKRTIAVLWVLTCIVGFAGCSRNRAPAVPGAPVGPEVCMAGETLKFLVVTTDPDADSIRYQVDWGDALGDWTQLLASAESCTVVHAWSVTDTYAIKVRAEDARGLA